MRNILTASLIFVISTSAYCSNINLPSDEIPTVAAQFRLYQAVYREFDRPDFEPERTHVPGLAPIVDIAASYTKTLLKDDDAQIARLEKMWTKARSIIDDECMTVNLFMRFNLQLALLLSDKMPKSPWFNFSPQPEPLSLQDLYKSGNWESIEGCVFDSSLKAENEDPLFVSYPLCFPAILYDEEGDIKLSTFIEGYLNAPTLTLAALPARGLGPHGDLISDPATFLTHDLAHTLDLADALQHTPSNWKALKGVFMQLAQSPKPLTSFEEVGIFLLSHELDPPSDLASTAQHSQGELFEKLINRAKQEIDRDILECPTCGDVKGLLECAYDNLDFEPICSGNCKLTESEGHFDVHISSNDNPEYTPLQASAIVRFSATDSPNMERVELVSITIAEKNNSPLQHILDTPGCTANTTLHRSTAHLANFPDYVKLMNLAYGKPVLSESSTNREIKDQVLTFLTEFYELKKGTLS